MTRPTIALISIAFLILNCGKKESGSGGSNPDGPFTVSGVGQKGPFAGGSKVTVQPLKNDLTPTGELILGSTSDDLGNFKVEREIRNRYAEVTVEGYFFDEISGALSTGQIALRSILDLSEGAVRVNLLTNLQAERLRKLIGTGLSFVEARAQSKTELLQSLNIPKEAVTEQLDKLDLTDIGDGNAALIAASGVFLNASRGFPAELSSFMQTFIGEFSASGQINNDSIKAKLIAANSGLNMARIRNNLEKRLMNLGKTAIVASFEDFVDSDGDGKLNKFDSEEYRGARFSNSEIKMPVDLDPLKYTSMALNHNGNIYLTSGARGHVCGGYPPPNNEPMRVRKYNESEKTWSDISGINSDADGFISSFASINNKLYIFNRRVCLDTSIVLDILDTEGNTWSQKNALPCPSVPTRVVSLGGYLYAFWQPGECTNEIVFKRYSPIDDTWTAMPTFASLSSLSKCLQGFGLFSSGNNLFIYGGYIGNTVPGDNLCKQTLYPTSGKTFKYSIDSGNWTELADLPVGRTFPADWVTAGNRVWSVGGNVGEFVLSFDLLRESWSRHPIQFSIPRSGSAMFNYIRSLGVYNGQLTFFDLKTQLFYVFQQP